MSDDQMTERDKQLADAQTKATEANKGRTGKGMRVRVGQTRGKNPQVVSWDAFDDSLPETLPTTMGEFMELTKAQGGAEEKNVVGWLIDGFNSAQYTAASDPVAEFIESSWPEDIQRNFRLAVRNYATATQSTIEDAAALIKPGIVKALEAKKA